MYGHQSPPQPEPVDRLIVNSPSGPQDIFGGQTTKRSRKTSQGSSRKSPYGYGESPKSYSRSPRDQQQNQHVESHYNRPSSQEYVNVSPLQRDEAQIDRQDLHHDVVDRYDSPYQQEGDAYQQRFTDNIRNSPYRDSPYQHRDSPFQQRDSPYQQRDSPYQQNESSYYGSSPASRGYGHSPEGHSRPPPAPRPKSARPKTGRKKSARVRQRPSYQDQETSLPQQCDTSSILNAGKTSFINSVKTVFISYFFSDHI